MADPTNVLTNVTALGSNAVPNDITAAARYVSGTAEYLMGAGPAVVIVVACIGLGYILKALPFPNRYIPPSIWLAGGIIFPILAPPGSAPNTVRNPALLFVIIGVVMGLLSWIIHRTILKKFLDDKWFKPDNDTTIITKEVTVETHINKPKDPYETIT